MAYLGNRPVSGDNNSFRVLDDIKTHTFSFDGSSSSVVSTSDNTITHKGHRLIQGQRVTYTDGTGSAIGGLTDGTVYFVVMNDANSFKLASSASNASAGTAVNLSALGSGTAHNITVAFDGVNTKFKATYNNGTEADVTRVAQIQISLNNVIQQPQNTATPTSGFGFESDSVIVFASAPASTVTFWGVLFANNFPTFEISDNDVDNFTGNGSTTEFSLSKSPASNENIIVTIDGVVQYPSDNSTTRAYNTVGNALQFSSAPADGADIQARHIGFAGPDESGGVTAFYGRTGSVFLNSSDSIVVNNAEVAGNLTVQGDTTTLNTTLRNVELLRVDGNDTVAAGIITQRGSGDILKLYDTSSPVFVVTDGGKVGIGTDNPSAELDIEGAAARIHLHDFDSNQAQILQNGSALYLNVDSEGNGGGSFRMRMGGQTGDEEVLRVNTAGNVGIGTNATGDAKLHVVGDIKATGIVTASSFVGGLPITNGADNRVITATSASAIQGEAGLTFDGSTLSNAGTGFKEIGASSSTNNSATLRLQNSVKNFSISNVTGGKFAIADGSTQRFIIDGSGNVGVGTVTISTRFEIEGTAALTNHNQTLFVRDSVSDDATGRGGNIGFGAYVDGTMRTLAAISALKKNSGTGFDGHLAFYTRRNGVGPVDEVMRLESGGNVGIGTDDPDGNLHLFSGSAGTVTADGDANELVLEGTTNVGMSLLTGATSIARIKFGSPTQTNRGVIAYDHANDKLLFNTAGAEKLQITSDGEVRIADGGLLTINTDAVSTYGVSEALRIDDNNLTNDRAFQIFEYQNAGARWHSFNQNLHVTTTGTSYTYTQGNYGGSNMIEMNNGDLKIYSDPTIVGGGTSAITPSERLRIRSSGDVNIIKNLNVSGVSTFVKESNFNSGTIITGICTIKDSGTGPAGEGGPFIFRDGGRGPDIVFHSSENTLASPTASGDGDNIGNINFAPHDGTEYIRIASINAKINGTVSTGNVPTDLLFRTGSTAREERLRITSAGDVGISTNNPQTLLHLKSDDPTLRIQRYNQSAYGDITADTAGKIIFKSDPDDAASGDGFSFTVDNSEKVRITSAGNVGIGSEIPTAILDVFKAYNGLGPGNAAARIYGIDTGVAETGVRFVEKGSNLHTSSSAYLMRGISNGATKFVFGSNGNVGIGTDTPTELIDVYKTSNDAVIKVRTTTAGAYFVADSPAAAGYYGLALSSAGTDRWFVGSYNSSNFQIKDGTKASGIERFTIQDGTGNIGIGTNIPDSPLHIHNSGPGIRLSDSNNAGAYAYFDANAANAIIHADKDNEVSDSRVAFSIDNDEKMRIEADGKVGIGTNNPTNKFEVFGTDATVTLLNYGQSSGGLAAWTSGRLAFVSAHQNDDLVFGYSNSTLSVGNFVERMRIDNGTGNIQIGSAADPGNTLRFLDVYNYNTGSDAGSILRLITRESDGTDSTSADIVKYKSGSLHIKNNEVLGTAGFIAFETGTGEKVRINSSGNVGIGTNNPTQKLEVKYGEAWIDNNSGDSIARSDGLTVSHAPSSDFTIGSDPGDSLRTATFAVKGASRAAIVSLRNMDDNAAFWDFIADGNTNKFHIQRGAGNSYRGSAVSIDANLNVGIGTNAAGTKLDVFGFFQVKDSTGKLSMQMDGANGNFKVFQSPSSWTSLTYNPNPILAWDYKNGSGPGDLMYMASGGNTPTVTQMALVISDNHGFKVGRSGYDGTDFDVDPNNEFFRVTKDGNVGIGTNSPGYRLHVYHPTINTVAKFESGDAGAGFLFQDPTCGTRLEQSGAAFKIDVDAGGDTTGETISFQMSGSEKLHITSDGKIGIGINDPDSILETVSPATNGINAHLGGQYNDGGQSAIRRIEFGTKNYRNAIQSQQASGGTSFSSNNDLLINPSGGKIGIGTVNPLAPVDIYTTAIDTATLNTTNCLQLGLWVRARTPSNTTGNIYTGITLGEGRTGLYAYDDGGGAAHGMGFWTGSNSGVSEKLRITSTGEIGISSITHSSNNATGVIKYMSGSSLPDNVVGGITVKVGDEQICNEIKLPRNGCIMVMTGFSDAGGTTYPQPQAAGMFYIDVGPSKLIRPMYTQGGTGADDTTNVGIDLVGRNTNTSTVSDCTDGKITIMPGSTEGTIRICNRESNTPYVFFLTFL